MSAHVLIGLETAYLSRELASPWEEATEWDLADGYVLVLAHAGDEEAFLVAKKVESPRGARWRIIGAMEQGGPCERTLGHECEVDGVADPWVFAETQIASAPSAGQSAWRAGRDGSISPIDARRVTCASHRMRDD